MATLYMQQNTNSNKHLHCDQTTINNHMILSYYPNCFILIKNNFTQPKKSLKKRLSKIMVTYFHNMLCTT